jgi:hypothetical protein
MGDLVLRRHKAVLLALKTPNRVTNDSPRPYNHEKHPPEHRPNSWSEGNFSHDEASSPEDALNRSTRSHRPGQHQRFTTTDVAPPGRQLSGLRPEPQCLFFRLLSGQAEDVRTCLQIPQSETVMPRA